MSEWKEIELGKLVELRKDTWKVGNEQLPYLALEHFVADGLRIDGIGNSNLIASNKYYFDSNNFLFGKLRPYFRKLYRPDFKGICSTDIWVLQPKDKNDKDFLFYFFANKEFVDYSYSGSSGTRMPRADWKFVSNSRWKFPEPPEQRAIASVLSSLDDKIDLLHRQNQTLEAMAETLFREWFVERKIEKRVGYLGEYIDKTIGGAWGKENPEGEYIQEVNCIRGTDIGDLENGLAHKCPIRYVKEKKFKKAHPKNGDLIIEISGGTEGQSTGRTCYITKEVKDIFNNPLVFSNFCRLIRPKNPDLVLFIYGYIRYLYAKGHFFNLQNGSSGIRNLDYKGFL